MGQIAGGKGVVVVAIEADLGFLGNPRLLWCITGVPEDLLEGRRVIPPWRQLIPAGAHKGRAAPAVSAMGR